VAVVLIGFAFNREAALYAALGAFLGHLFPVWLGFKGGKGVATYIGLLLGLALWLGLIAFCLIWIAIAAALRYSSLAALAASAATPAVLWWNDNLPEAKLFLLLTVLIWLMHRANIARLISGTESQIGGV
jgi:acyl phosphate:glycerol-3-phosphate acyltransferase